MLEGIPSRDIIDKESASCPAIVGSSDGAEGFLAGRIPDLQFDLFAVDIYHSGPKFYSDCEVVDGLESFVGELQ